MVRNHEGLGLKKIFRGVTCFLFLSILLPVIAHAAPSQSEENAEDYKLLKDIIVTEFSTETPHEWGDAVSGVKTHLKTQEKVIAIGLDADAIPEKEGSSSLVEFFQRENIPVTLFVSGGWIDRNSALLKKLAANPLFEIANHGLDQKPCSISGKSIRDKKGTRNVEEVFAEIEKNARKIEAMTGVLPQYYRSGAGYYDEVAVRIVKALGYEAVGSDLKLPQGTGVTRQQVFDSLMNPSAGAIAILQAGTLNKTVSDGIIDAVRTLRAKGYKFVKLSDYPLD